MIKYSIRGENIEVTEALRDYVESKLSKVEKYFNEDQELNARVNLKVYREKTAKVEVTIPTGSVTLRAEDVSQQKLHVSIVKKFQQEKYSQLILITNKLKKHQLLKL